MTSKKGCKLCWHRALEGQSLQTPLGPPLRVSERVVCKARQLDGAGWRMG